MRRVRRGWGPVARPEALGAEAGPRKIAVAIYTWSRKFSSVGEEIIRDRRHTGAMLEQKLSKS